MKVRAGSWIDKRLLFPEIVEPLYQSNRFNEIVAPPFFVYVEIEQLGERKFDKVRLHSFDRIQIQFYRDGKKNYGHSLHAFSHHIITQFFSELVHKKNIYSPQEKESGRRKKRFFSVRKQLSFTWMKLNGMKIRIGTKKNSRETYLNESVCLSRKLKRRWIPIHFPYLHALLFWWLNTSSSVFMCVLNVGTTYA